MDTHQRQKGHLLTDLLKDAEYEMLCLGHQDTVDQLHRGEVILLATHWWVAGSSGQRATGFSAEQPRQWLALQATASI